MEGVELRGQQARLELKACRDQRRESRLHRAVHPEEVSSSFLSFSILVSDVCVGTRTTNLGVTGDLEGGSGELEDHLPLLEVKLEATGECGGATSPYSSPYHIHYISPLHSLPCFYFIILQCCYTVLIRHIDSTL